MSAHPDSRHVARGHVRIDRSAIVPNAPAAPDPPIKEASRVLEVVRAAWPSRPHVAILALLAECFGDVVPYSLIAREVYGCPDSDTLRDAMSHSVRQLRRAFAVQRQKYRIVNVIDRGYQLVEGDPRLDLPKMGPRQRRVDDVLYEYDLLTKAHPKMSQRAKAERLKVPESTLRGWLDDRAAGRK